MPTSLKMHFDLDTIDTVQVDRIKSNFDYQGNLHKNRFHIKWNFQTHKIQLCLSHSKFAPLKEQIFGMTKDGFFQKVQFVFHISQSPRKNIPKKLS